MKNIILILPFLLGGCVVNNFDSGKENGQIGVTDRKVYILSNLLSEQHQVVEEVSSSIAGFDLVPEEEAEYKVMIKLIRRPANGLTSFLSGFTSIVSLCTIPTYTRQEFDLHYSVFRRNQFVDDFIYRDSVDTWCYYQIIMNPHSVDAAIRGMVDNSTKLFLKEAIDSGAFVDVYSI